MTSEQTMRVDQSAPFGAVLEVVNRFDPENLLALGAPRDEYEAEAADLSALIRAGEPVTVAAVRQVWERWFGPRSCLSVRMPADALGRFAEELELVRASYAA